MNKRQFSNSPHYLQSVRGLHKLHELDLAGKAESPEADAVRASLEEPWSLLSEVERRRITGLSEDLFSINGPNDDPLPMNPQAQKNIDEFYEHRRLGDWDRALDILRRWGNYIEHSLLSYARGSVWLGAGDYRTATLFFEEAARSDKENANYKWFYLFALEEAAPAKALEVAQRILESAESQNSAVIGRAAEIVYASVQSQTVAVARSVVEGLIKPLESALKGLGPEEFNLSGFQKSSYVRITTLLGFCHKAIGDRDGAIRYLNDALLIDPGNSACLVTRGILNYGSGSGAIEDFRRAIEVGSSVVWPHFFLAHHALTTDRFEECARQCDAALHKCDIDELKGLVFEWRAIARAEQGFPIGDVRADFEKAIAFAPDDDRIQRNLRSFEDAVAGNLKPKEIWEITSIQKVQQIGSFDYSPRPQPLAA
jgi:tetratricopeptide (TPR) repeat protein